MKRIKPPSRASYREALLVCVVWVLACAATVGGAAGIAYLPPERSAEMYFGIPKWMVWCVLVPWGACFAVTLWFAAYGLTDEPLGENPDEAPDGE